MLMVFVTYHYFLGLQTLDILAETLELIEVYEGVKLNLDDIPRDDTYTFDTIFKNGNTGKVFQFESSGMKKLLKRMKPTCLADLCAANAAYRPGPMQFIDEFIDGRNNPDTVKYPTKEYEAIAKETKGILFYQEQIMQLVQAMAGFTLGEADVLRRGIGKKEKKYIDEGREMFVKGCLKLGTADEKTAKYIYSTIEKFANYGFNKSHSDAYGLVAYLCGYLKAHYPECFMAANLTICSHDVKKLAYTLSETRKMGITILPPDVRYSSDKFILEKVDGKYDIRYSLAAIKSIREENAEIFANVKDKSSLYSFVQGVPVKNIRKNQISNLIYSGAFDYLGTRLDLVENLGKIIDAVKVIDNYKSNHIPSILTFLSPNIEYNRYEFQQLYKLEKEKDCIQMALSGHPVEAIRNIVKVTNTIPDFMDDIFDESQDEIENINVEIAGLITEVKEFTTKTGHQMCFCKVEDEFASIDGVVFHKDYEKIGEILKESLNVPVLIQAKLQKKMVDDEVVISLIINHVGKIVKNTYTLYIDNTLCNDEILSSISKFNGIASVILVNTREKTVEKLPFNVDVNGKLLSILRQNKVNYIVKK